MHASLERRFYEKYYGKRDLRRVFDHLSKERAVAKEEERVAKMEEDEILKEAA